MNQFLQSLRHFFAQLTEIAFDPSVTTYQDMIGPGLAQFWKQFRRQFAETTAHAIAHYGISDLFGDGDAQSLRWILVASVVHQQNETGSCITLPPVGSQKVWPLFDNGVTAHLAATARRPA